MKHVTTHYVSKCDTYQKVKTNLSYPEHPIKVLDQKDHVTRRKTIKFFKI
jgi:hypothetical protein